MTQPAGGVRAFVGLGANLGDARKSLAEAARALAHLPRTQLLAGSGCYRSAPVDAQGPDFFNAVVELRTQLTADELLAHLQRIEESQGRSRPFRNAPRTLDLDLLLYGEVRSSDLRLTLPHPRLHQRAFVLLPLLELDPDIRIPGIGPARTCLASVADQRIERIGELPSA